MLSASGVGPAGVGEIRVESADGASYVLALDKVNAHNLTALFGHEIAFLEFDNRATLADSSGRFPGLVSGRTYHAVPKGGAPGGAAGDRSGRSVDALEERTEVLKVFRRFDTNKSGDIDEVEFRALCVELGREITPEKTSEIFQLIDTDKSGTIDFAEFGYFYLIIFQNFGGFLSTRLFQQQQKKVLRLVHGKQARTGCKARRWPAQFAAGLWGKAHCKPQQANRSSCRSRALRNRRIFRIRSSTCSCSCTCTLCSRGRTLSCIAASAGGSGSSVAGCCRGRRLACARGWQRVPRGTVRRPWQHRCTAWLRCGNKRAGCAHALHAA